MNKLKQSATRLGLKATLLAGGALFAVAATAHAQSGASPASTNFFTRPLMTGNWNGARTKLEDTGITFNGFYVGEYANGVSGGNRQGGDFAAQFGLGMDVDLGKLAGLEGASLHFAVNQRVGRNTSADYIGNRLAVQEVYGAGETLRIVEMSYEQKFDDGAFDTKIGFYPMGNDFAGTPLLLDFQNVGFCIHPQNLPASSGWSDYPTGKWGGRIKWMPTTNSYIQAGVYDVNPGYYAKENGMKVSTSGSTGALIPVEVEYTSALGAAGLPGHYKAGVYYDTSTVKNAADVTATQNAMETGRYGGYLLADQMIYSFDGTPKRGLIAFAQVSYSDPQTSVYESTLAGGVVAQGPFASRPNDFIALGYVRAGLNNRTINAKELASRGTLSGLSNGEGVVELGYGLKATPWLLIHPNVQYITDPGTFSYNKHMKNAWAIGLQTKVFF
ncbi:carbohydrate porin [Acidocella sp.]|uniref:carbohydrate porin n=1 Tax=Acidocella sp. TaxID=50710 RepID=UPI001850A712|nr:carbohydrate porin [Acidocella sp.]NNM56697.1 carbohydrate porin [Acidocella sp.]